VRTLRRVGALGVLAVVALLALAGTASADPGTEYVAGYGGAGRVMMRSTHPGENCITHRAIYVLHTDDAETTNGAERADSPPGMGWVCVTRAGYDWATIGKWWPGQSRPGVPRG
jgi:hypothetical protein